MSYQPGEIVDTTAIPNAYVNGRALHCGNETCGAFLCFVESGDSLATLCALARDHECGEAS